MKTTRRHFLKSSALLGTGVLCQSIHPLALAETAAHFLERIGVCTSLSNNGILAAAGFSYVEETVGNFLVPAEEESVFQGKCALLKESKLPVEACNVFIPGKLKSVGPAAAHDEILKFVETAFRRAQVAGVKTIVFGSGGSRSIPQDFPREKAKDQFLSLCRRMAPLAEKYRVVIVLEPLNTKECNYVNSVAEGAEIVQAVNHGNFQLLADVYHMLRENESPDNITRYSRLLYHTHIAENAGRAAPGTSKEDFTPYFKALKDAKYEGRMSIECSWKSLEAQAGPALKTMRDQLSTI